MTRRPTMRGSALALLLLVAGCSEAETATAAGNQVDVPTAAAAAPAQRAPVPVPAEEPKAQAEPEGGSVSRVLAKRDFTLRGKPACDIRYVYGGQQPDDLFWEEPCEAVTARMLGEQELKALGRWERLDDYAQSFVQGMPGGKVLYVEGSFSASVYPVGTTGSAYEVPVAD